MKLLLRLTLTAAMLGAGSLAWGAGDLATKFSNAGSVANTRHNMSQRPFAGGGTVSGVQMDPVRSDYGQICVYCHTPHGSNATVAKMPLWNRTVKATTYTTYSSQTITQEVSQPGVYSLSCLSCHDGQVAVDSIINMPGSGRYNANQAIDQDPEFLSGWVNPSGLGPAFHANMTDCLICHTPGPEVYRAPATDFSVALIGTNLANDHPVGVTYPSSGVDFRAMNTTFKNAKFIDGNGNGRPDKNEVRIYDSGNGKFQVECSSCHDPHGVPTGGVNTAFMPTFLRVTAAGSAICLSCHVK